MEHNYGKSMRRRKQRQWQIEEIDRQESTALEWGEARIGRYKAEEH